ncbi:hypothetical protein HID58_071334, partial [Brassica napus]
KTDKYQSGSRGKVRRSSFSVVAGRPPPFCSMFLLSPLFSLLCFIWRVRLGIPVKHGRGVDVLVPLSEWSRGGFDLVSDLSFGCGIFLVSLVSLLGLLGWVSELAWLKASWGPSDGGAAVLLPLVGLVSSGVLFGPVNFLSGASRSCLRFQAGLVFDGFSVAGACAARMVAGWRLLSCLSGAGSMAVWRLWVLLLQIKLDLLSAGVLGCRC